MKKSLEAEDELNRVVSGHRKGDFLRTLGSYADVLEEQKERTTKVREELKASLEAILELSQKTDGLKTEE